MRGEANRVVWHRPAHAHANGPELHAAHSFQGGSAGSVRSGQQQTVYHPTRLPLGLCLARGAGALTGIVTVTV